MSLRLRTETRRLGPGGKDGGYKCQKAGRRPHRLQTVAQAATPPRMRSRLTREIRDGPLGPVTVDCIGEQLCSMIRWFNHDVVVRRSSDGAIRLVPGPGAIRPLWRKETASPPVFSQTVRQNISTPATDVRPRGVVPWRCRAQRVFAVPLPGKGHRRDLHDGGGEDSKN